MEIKLEYLGEGEITVQGVGRFGVTRINRKAMQAYHKQVHEAGAKGALPEMPEPERMTLLPCTAAIAKSFEEDERFKVHRIAPLHAVPPSPSTSSGQAAPKKSKKKGKE